MENEYTDTRPMSVGEWMLTILILAIPLVNIIMYLVWAFSGTGNINRRHYCRAVVYWFFILLGIYLVIIGLAALTSLVR